MAKKSIDEILAEKEVTEKAISDTISGMAFFFQNFNGSTDDDAWAYLQMANRVIHESHPGAISIAEDVSGMPGVAAPAKDFGIGFDYRMAMGEPDFWFRLAEKVSDDNWPMGGIFWELTNKRAEEKVVSYHYHMPPYMWTVWASNPSLDKQNFHALTCHNY